MIFPNSIPPQKKNKHLELSHLYFIKNFDFIKLSQNIFHWHFGF